MARLSASRPPMKLKFPGNRTTLAPDPAAPSIRLPAAARFAATSGPEVICTAAKVVTIASSTRPALGRRVLGGLLGLARPDVLDLGLVPAAGNAIVAAREARQRL